MKRKVNKLRALFGILIAVSVLTALSGRAVCIRNTNNYDVLQPELFAPDEIRSVLYDEETKQLYVCYNDASYVNVYTESGEFLWAVSTPYLRNAYFELQNGRLIIYNEEAYVYNSSDGTFIERVSAEKLGLEYGFESDSADNFREGEFYFDSYQVYRANSAGKLETVIFRPWWYWCFNSGVCVGIAFLGIIAFLLTFIPEKIKDVRELKNFEPSNDEQKLIFDYFRITSAVHIVYAVLNVFSVFFGGILCILLFPLGIHFVISGIILTLKFEKVRATKEERSALEFWRIADFITFIGAFASVFIVAVCVAG